MKAEFEGKLKDLQGSLLGMKKQIPSSDNKQSLEKVIYMLVIRQSTDYVCCVGEMQGLLCFIVSVGAVKWLWDFFGLNLDIFFLFSYVFVAHIKPQMPHTHINSTFCSTVHSSCSFARYSSLITYPKELQCCHDNLKRAHADLDKQRGELQKRSEALQALEKASAGKEAELLSEINKLKEQLDKETVELKKALEKAKEVKHHLASMENNHINILKDIMNIT